MDKQKYRLALFAVDLYFGYRFDRLARFAKSLAPNVVNGWLEDAFWDARARQLRLGVASVVARHLADEGGPHLFPPEHFADILAATMGAPHLDDVRALASVMGAAGASPVAGRLLRALAHRRYWVAPLGAASAAPADRRLPSGGCARLTLDEYDRYARRLGPRETLVAQMRADAVAILAYSSSPDFWRFLAGESIGEGEMRPEWLAVVLGADASPRYMELLTERFVRREVARVFARP